MALVLTPRFRVVLSEFNFPILDATLIPLTELTILAIYVVEYIQGAAVML
jgi:hypothetical protein